MSERSRVVDAGESVTTGVMHPVTMLALLAACHFLVDIVAGTTVPLWPSLELHLSIDEGGLLWVYVAWSIATSFTQLFFGMMADRWRSRWLLWIGPLVGIVCISSVGWADTSMTLAGLFVLGGLGIAAFHPEAAATAGALLPNHRSRAMAVFALCGYLGQAVGPYYSGLVTDRLGPEGLTWSIAWGVPVLAVLFLGLRKIPAKQSTAHAAPSGKFDVRGKLLLISLLLAVGSLRILPALGVPLSLAYLLKSSDSSNAVIGAVQSAFMAGIGCGSILCAVFVRREWERNVLWIFPLIASPFLGMIGWAEGWSQVALVGMCGLLLGVTMPVYISYGQQLLPNGQRVASAITMGVSWGIGGGVAAAAIGICLDYAMLPSIFGLFSVAALGSSLLSYPLPRPPVTPVAVD